MPDLAGQTPDPASALEPEEKPAAEMPDIENLVSQITEKVVSAIQPKIDERFGGFQRVIAKKDSQLESLNSQLRELQLAGLSEEEREQVTQSEKDARIRQLEAELELERLGRKYPDLIDEYRSILTAETAEAQILALQALRQTAHKAEPEVGTKPTDGGQPSVPEVDPNLPATNDTPGFGERLFDPDLMTDELADRVLRAHGDAPMRPVD